MKPFQGFRKCVSWDFPLCLLNGAVLAKLLKSELLRDLHKVVWEEVL